MEKNTKIIMILSAIICILLIWGSLFFADNYPQTFECDELKITTPIDGGYYDDSFGSLSLSDENQSNVIFIAIIPDSEERFNQLYNDESTITGATADYQLDGCSNISVQMGSFKNKKAIIVSYTCDGNNQKDYFVPVNSKVVQISVNESNSQAESYLNGLEFKG